MARRWYQAKHFGILNPATRFEHLGILGDAVSNTSIGRRSVTRSPKTGAGAGVGVGMLRDGRDALN